MKFFCNTRVSNLLCDLSFYYGKIDIEYCCEESDEDGYLCEHIDIIINKSLYCKITKEKEAIKHKFEFLPVDTIDVAVEGSNLEDSGYKLSEVEIERRAKLVKNIHCGFNFLIEVKIEEKLDPEDYFKERKTIKKFEYYASDLGMAAKIFKDYFPFTETN